MMRLKFWKKAEFVHTNAEEALAPLPQVFRLALLSMYAGEPQQGTSGEKYPIDSKTLISPEQGMWIYDLCRELKPKKTAEIGLAYGFSTIYILAALHENGAGLHFAIDPCQSSDFHDIGLCQPAKVGMSSAFRFIPERSVPAFVDLIRSGDFFEFIFIDGSHHFDDALADFMLSSEVCLPGGCIVFDDMWLPAIQRAVSFVRTNRADFAEMPTPIPNIAAFRKIAKKDTRDSSHYVDF
jgi:predicted O-methyltransferase YrrM